MSESLFNDPKGFVIAHRGCSFLKQENSTVAFKLASEKSYFGIETDIHITKDHEIIVCHDDDIYRVTGVHKIIEKSKFSDLRKINLLYKDGSKSDDLFLPTLEEYINICKSHAKTAVLELKNQFKFKDVKKVYEAIKDLGYLDKMIFISFHPKNLKYLTKLDKNLHLQLLSDVKTDQEKMKAIKIAKKNHYDLDCNYLNLTDSFISICQSLDISLNVYTCDDLEIAKDLIKKGVKYLTTNRLE